MPGESFKDALEEAACKLIKKVTNGENLTANEIIFLKSYLRNINRPQQTITLQKILQGAKSIVNFIKDNFGGLLSAGVTETDNYQINVEDN